MNIKTGLLICCAATLVACGSKDAKTPEVPNVSAKTGAPEAPKTPSYELKSSDLKGYSYDISKYSGVSVGEPMDAAIKQLKKHLTPEGEGNMSVTWETQDQGKGIKIFTGLAQNMADDSVKDQEIKLVLKKDDGEYWVLEHGGRVKCRRGDNQDKWTTKPCP